MTFTRSQTLLSDARLAEIEAGRANAGIATPIDTVITEVVARVGEYVKEYVVPDAILTPLVRALVLAELLAPIGAASEAQLTAAKDALKELREIRATGGGFPRQPTAPAGTTYADAGAGWGSAPNKLL